MKIVEVVYTLQSGGAERFIVDLSNEFARNGHEVTLLTIRDIDKNPASAFFAKVLDKNISVRQLKAKYPEPGTWYRLNRMLTELAPDIVHMHLNTIPYFFPHALKKNGTRYFHTIHSIAESSIGYPGQKPLNKFYYRSGRIIPVTISDFCNRSFQKLYHLPPAECIYNGRSELSSERTEAVQTEVENLKIHADDKVFIQAATICRNKNQQLAVETFARLYKEGHHAILLMLGKDYDKEYFKSVMQLAAPNAFYLGEKDNVGDYLNCADAFMLASHYEGNPISILEAFACGVPAVCTAVGGIVDTVIEGQTGYLADKVEPESFYNAVMRYLNDPEKITPESLKLLFQQKYTMKICAAKYLELFEKYLRKQ